MRDYKVMMYVFLKLDRFKYKRFESSLNTTKNKTFRHVVNSMEIIVYPNDFEVFKEIDDQVVINVVIQVPKEIENKEMHAGFMKQFDRAAYKIKDDGYFRISSTCDRCLKAFLKNSDYTRHIASCQGEGIEKVVFVEDSLRDYMNSLSKSKVLPFYFTYDLETTSSTTEMLPYCYVLNMIWDADVLHRINELGLEVEEKTIIKSYVDSEESLHEITVRTNC